MSRCRRGENFTGEYSSGSSEYVGNPYVKATKSVPRNCSNCGDGLNSDEIEAGVCRGGCFNYDGTPHSE